MAEEAKAPSCTLDFLGEMERTHLCGELRTSDDGKSAVLMGWVARRRDLGNLIFIDLRDRSGITQVVFDNQANPALHAKAETLRNEYVVAVSGRIKKRDADTINPNIETGEVELVAEELRILNVSAQPPFYPTDAVLPNEELRLKFRYIDLRRPEMAKNIVMRHEISQAVRKYLTSQGFLEIETPFLGRSTPEGARDYLVPSRVHHGSFYALPQSPQLFKQILMISGMDKYFQLARCFRDEDLRADRQPEFTQIDLEMSFPKLETIFAYVEGFLREAFKVAGHELTEPFPQITYDQAIRFYGSDKPDLRLPALTNVREAFSDEDMKELALDPAMPVVLIRIPKVGELSRKERDDIRPLFGIKSDGAKLFEDFGRLEKKFPVALGKVREMIKPEADELLVLVSGPQRVNGNVEESPSRTRQREYAVYNSAGNLRVVLAQKYAERHGLFKPGDFRFLWVTDFPMFEWDEEGKRWAAAHHAFTSPHEKDMDILESDPASVRALAYDVVLNGMELGSGSIRIHRQDIQQRIFRAMGMTDEDAVEKFGFFLEALRYGTPPHGGIALGLDRIVMLLAGAESLREVIPFPKTAKAIDVMSDAPSPVTKAQLDELGIKLKD